MPGPLRSEFALEGVVSRTPFPNTAPAGAALACSAFFRAAFSRAASATLTLDRAHAPVAALALAFVFAAACSLFAFECPPPKIPLHQCPPPLEFAADLPDSPARAEFPPVLPAGPPSATPVPPECVVPPLPWLPPFAWLPPDPPPLECPPPNPNPPPE